MAAFLQIESLATKKSRRMHRSLRSYGVVGRIDKGRVMTSQDDHAGGSLGGFSRRSFLVGSAAAAALTASNLTGTASAATSSAPTPAQPGSFRKGTLRVGAGKAAISIPASLLPLDNFTSVHDSLYVRVLLLENGASRIALAVLDLTSISEDAITDMRGVITAASGVLSQNIIVTVTHSFSSPHVMSASQSAQEATWVGNIVAATSAAVSAAVAALQPAKVGYGTGKADVNVNRNVLTAQGRWLGTDEDGPSDKSVGVARFDDLSGNPLAILVNYNVQSCVMQDSVMANGDLPISADLAGATLDHVESQYGNGVVGFWLVGACGDQFPAFRSKRYTIDKDKNWTYGIDAHDAGFLLLTVQGERLGTEVVRVAQTISPSSDQTLHLMLGSVTVPEVQMGHAAGPVTSYNFVSAGTAQAPIWVLRVGNGILAGAEPELSTRTSQYIKEHSAFEHTFVMSMFEGGAKNMADRWNYEHLTYESVDSGYGEGAAEKLEKQVVRSIAAVRR